MKNKHPKPGYLGPAFHEWLEWLEYVECVFTTQRNPGKPKHMALNDTLFTVDSEQDFEKMCADLMPVDAYLARVVRSSVKYRVDASVLFDLNDHYSKEMMYIFNTRPLHLPHEWCTLVIENVRKPGDHVLVCAQETLPTDSKAGCYPELGLHGGDEKFIDCNLAMVRQTGVTGMDNKVIQSQRVSTVPVELHFNKGKIYSETKFLNAIADGVTPTVAGTHIVDLIRHLITQWIFSFHLAGVLRHKSVVGVPPQGKLYGRTKRRKKSAHPVFEHIVVELPINDPESSQTGRSVFQPKKRLHQVRGFMRHYKSGKTAWVKSHWRGDEKLGVIRHDFEMTLDEERMT